MRRLSLEANDEQSAVSGKQENSVKESLVEEGLVKEGIAGSGQQASPDLMRFLWVWLTLGAQSFGGGVATMALIRQASVERYGWLTEAEFTRDWALVQVAPGINLIALIILIGRRVAGWRGIVLCLIGLLLPSAAITILLTASYAHIQRLPLMQSALRGVVPATVGIGMVTAVQMALPILAASRKDGALSLLVGVIVLIGSGLAVFWLRVPVVPVLCGAGGIGALAHILHEHLAVRRPDHQSKPQPEHQEGDSL